MTNNLSLLVVDMFDSIETQLKDIERGYLIENDFGLFEAKPSIKESVIIEYPYGTERAGFNAIIDTVRLAYERKYTIYDTYLYDGWSDGEEFPCASLVPYIPKENIFEKHGYDAFGARKLSERLKADNVKNLMILGYDRDCCVLETTKGAIKNGINVITSEHIMLTRNKDNPREKSLEFYRANTTFLESLVDVWNYLL